MTDEGPAGSAEQPSRQAGMDMVRRTLEEARGAARMQGKDVGRGLRGAPSARRRSGGGDRRRWSGPAPDARDPQSLGAVTRGVIRTQGWTPRVSSAAVFGQWRAIVGDQIADHADPVSLRDGVLAISAQSTAWATQLRMVQSQLLAKIAARVGDGVVTMVKVTGPAAPSWRKGRLHVAGRGPRDTYG